MTDQNNGAPALLSAQETASMLSMCPASVIRLAKRGEVPGMVKIGSKAIRFRRAELERWIEVGCPVAVEAE